MLEKEGPPLWEAAWEAQSQSATLADPPPSAKFGADWDAWLARHPFVISDVAEEATTK